MARLEATGDETACVRCGRPLPGDEAEKRRWGGLFLNGRLVQLVCPDCLTDEERREQRARNPDDLVEVTSARAADLPTLRELAQAAADAGRRAPAEAWLARLAPGGRHIGVLTGDAQDDWVLVMWAGETPEGERVATLGQVAIERWMALDEWFVPYAVQAWAARAAREAGAA